MGRIMRNDRWEGNPTFPEQPSDFSFGITLANPAADVFLVNRLQTTARDQALNRVQQLQPIFHRWVGHGLPLFESLRPLIKIPLPADTLGIDLEFLPVLGAPFPTDLGFGHLN